jgi:hypothetical protein
MAPNSRQVLGNMWDISVTEETSQSLWGWLKYKVSSNMWLILVTEETSQEEISAFKNSLAWNKLEMFETSSVYHWLIWPYLFLVCFCFQTRDQRHSECGCYSIRTDLHRASPLHYFQAKILVKGSSMLKHISHVDDGRDVPIIEKLVECCSIIKHVRHVLIIERLVETSNMCPISTTARQSTKKYRR